MTTTPARTSGRKAAPHATDDDGARLHAHHIVPLSKGGSNRIDNLVTLCETCQNRVHEHDVTPPEPSGTPDDADDDYPPPTDEHDFSVEPGTLAFSTYPLYMVGALTLLTTFGVYYRPGHSRCGPQRSSAAPTRCSSTPSPTSRRW